VLTRGLIQPSHDRVSGRDGAEEAHARSALLDPEHDHREPLARRQFDCYAVLRFDARRAFKFEAMLRVVNDVDATARAVSMQNRPDTHSMPGRTSCPVAAWLRAGVHRSQTCLRAPPGSRPRAHHALTAQDVACLLTLPPTRLLIHA
jgi:hypothetical protein